MQFYIVETHFNPKLLQHLLGPSSFSPDDEGTMFLSVSTHITTWYQNPEGCSQNICMFLCLDESFSSFNITSLLYGKLLCQICEFCCIIMFHCIGWLQISGQFCKLVVFFSAHVLKIFLLQSSLPVIKFFFCSMGVSFFWCTEEL